MRRTTSGISMLAAALFAAVLSGCGGEDRATAADTGPAAPAPTPTASVDPKAIQRSVISRATMTDGGKASEFRPDLHTVVGNLVIPPGGSTGWHVHYDGGAFIINKGTATTYGLNGSMCEAKQVTAGNAIFVPPMARHQHLVRNEGTETIEATTYYWNVPPDAKGTATPADQPKECPADLK